MVTPVGSVFLQSLSRSAAAAIELLGDAFAGMVVSDRFSPYNHLAAHQRQLCWVHLKRDLVAMAEHTGAAVGHWQQWKNRPVVNSGCNHHRL